MTTRFETKPGHLRNVRGGDCSFDRSSNSARARGLCKGHWKQWRRGCELRPLSERTARSKAKIFPVAPGTPGAALSQLPMRAVPKPVKAAKKARKPLTAKRWGVSRSEPRIPKQVKRQRTADPSSYPAQAFPKPVSQKGTAHSRRPRETGFMHFAHERDCELALDRDTQRILGIVHDCSFERVEFAHLGDRRRYEKGDIGACLCVTIHRGIDGRIGGKLPWYVALGRSGQSLIRMRLANRARAAWDALKPEEREDWERRAEARRVASSPRARRPR